MLRTPAIVTLFIVSVVALYGANVASAFEPPAPTSSEASASDAASAEDAPVAAPASDASKRGVPKEATGGATDGATGSATQWRPIAILVIGMVLVLGLIIGLKLNAFVALITGAMVVSLLAPGEPAQRVARVAEAFGGGATKIGIVIAMAAIIGKCMLDSGAADRIVRTLTGLMGQRLTVLALMLSGFILAVPVFFDTVFYLLVPLARSLYRRTGKNYLLYLLAIAGGGAITHTLVPPTPGPTTMAAELGFKLGTMIIIGAVVALPAALAGMLFSLGLNRFMPIPMRSLSGQPEPSVPDDDDLPPFWLAILPVILPVLLIATDSILDTVAVAGSSSSLMAAVRGLFDVLGNPNLALMISTAVALAMLVWHTGLDRREVAQSVEVALMSGGVIILITSAGSAFGQMLQVAGVKEIIEARFAPGPGGTMDGLQVLLLGFGVAAVLKVAQGSSTVAMVTGSSMLAGMAAGQLPFHPVYLACAIGAGSLIGSWMNDSGFWIFAKMGGLTEMEALKSWTVLLLVLGGVSMGVTLLLATFLPLAAL